MTRESRRISQRRCDPLSDRLLGDDRDSEACGERHSWACPQAPPDHLLGILLDRDSRGPEWTKASHDLLQALVHHRHVPHAHCV